MYANRLVVILEDDPGIIAVARRVCDAAAIPALSFSTVAEFLAGPLVPDSAVILLDLGLGDGNGIDILRALAARRCGAVIYLMSGQDDRLLGTVQKLGQSYGLDVRGILQKPFSLADLQAAIQAKPAGTNAAVAGATVVEELHRAIISGEFCLHYQPKIAVATGAIVGCEALLRWEKPGVGLVQPGEFLPIAEEAGLMNAITRWVLREAVAQAAHWRAEGLQFGVAVNMPADMLNEMHLPGLIDGLLRTYELPGRLLTLEVTEAAAMKNLLTAVDVLARVRLLGVTLSIDDFGTGHASIVKLRQLPFNEMKIDRSFVRDIDRDADARVLVGAMITMGHSFGMTTVAEGVEHAHDLGRLESLGCVAAQGFHFSRPLPPADFLSWTARHGAGDGESLRPHAVV